MRVAVLDIGTNSTRLLVADAQGGSLSEIERRSTVTRLGRGVDLSGQLSNEAIDDVCDTLSEYLDEIERLEVERTVAIATSAVRDAANADAFTAELRERFGLSAEILSGEREAELTFAGATSGRPATEPTLVIDIGGGSTELVIGQGSEITMARSLQAGTVRHSERYVSHDPPETAELEDLARSVRSLIDAEIGDGGNVHVATGIAVAGTPTSLAAIDQELEPYDPVKVHGYVLGLDTIQRMLSKLSAMPLEQRLEVRGLHSGRAPTIVAGVVILVQVIRAFGLSEVEVSEHDILWGAALDAAHGGP